MASRSTRTYNTHAPIPHPLKSAFNIKLYNDMWFSEPLDTSPPKLSALEQWTFERATELQHTASSPLPPETCAIPVVAADLPTEVNAASPPSLADEIQHSEDRLFFVRYTPDGTL